MAAGGRGNPRPPTDLLVQRGVEEHRERGLLMIRRIAAAFTLLALGATLALAEPLKGRVTSIEGKKVQLTITGEKPDWFKKGAMVKWTGGVGRIVEVTDDTMTMNTRQASKLKVDDELEPVKGPAALEGC